MEIGGIDIEEFENPSEKVKKLYEAVNMYTYEGADLSTLKVSDIASRAGIGKGTTYEYFKSKEELIAKATFYNIYGSVKAMTILVYSEGAFTDKFYGILEYIWNNKIDSRTLVSLFKATKGEVGMSFGLHGFGEKGFEFANNDGKSECECVLEKIMDDFTEQALTEGLISERDLKIRRNVLSSQIMQYVFFIQDPDCKLEIKEIEDYIFKGLINLLNIRK